MRSRCVCPLILLVIAAPVLADQRLADYRRVVVSDQPLEVQKAAANELAQFVGRVAGTKLEIVSAANYDAKAAGLSFFVGEEVARKLLGVELRPWKDEEHVLRTVPAGLIVAGQDGEGKAWSPRTVAGTMLAAYALLDGQLGVKWFWPGPFGEHAPARPDLILPDLDARRAPRFMIRSIGFNYDDYSLREYGHAQQQWLRRNGLGWTRPAVFGHSWGTAFNLRKGKGGTRDEHPEWSALVNGTRRGPQMCTTHPEVIERMVEYVLKGKLDIMNISPSDGGGFCQCNEQTKSDLHKKLGIPSCTSLDAPGLLMPDGVTPLISDRIFTYANEVARRVREKNPNRGVGLHAYTYYNKPPVRIKQLEPNLYLSFVFQSISHRDPAGYQLWRDTVAGWQRLGAKMVVREGWGNHYHLDLPLLHYRDIIRSLSEAAKLGFIAAYGDGSKNFSTEGPNYWAIAKMLQDPERDGSKVMEEFWLAAYGPAAAEMKAFFETYSGALDRNWEKRIHPPDNPNVGGYNNLIKSWNLLLPMEVVDAADRRLAEAERKAPPGEYADRVAFHKFGQEYTRTMLELIESYRRLGAMGVKLAFFRDEDAAAPAADAAQKQALLQRAYELGEKREEMLLRHRGWAALNEGLYAFAVGKGLRPWHATVKKELGITKPGRFNKEMVEKLKENRDADSSPTEPEPKQN